MAVVVGAEEQGRRRSRKAAVAGRTRRAGTAPPVCSSAGSVLIRRSVRLSAIAGRLARASWAGRAGRLCAAPASSPAAAGTSSRNDMRRADPEKFS